LGGKEKKVITYRQIRRFAIGELGLKPWEFKRMSLNEYSLYAHGYFLRLDRNKEGLRSLYRLIWNVNVAKIDMITNNIQLKQHWPLLTDTKEEERIAEESMRERWDRVMKKKKQQKDANAKPRD
jgi:hypothetical protein